VTSANMRLTRRNGSARCETVSRAIVSSVRICLGRCEDYGRNQWRRLVSNRTSVSELLSCNAKVTSEVASERNPCLMSSFIAIAVASDTTTYARAPSHLGRQHAWTVSKLCQNPFCLGLWTFV
jgi:hypothetical protein